MSQEGMWAGSTPPIEGPAIARPVSHQHRMRPTQSRTRQIVTRAVAAAPGGLVDADAECIGRSTRIAARNRPGPACRDLQHLQRPVPVPSRIQAASTTVSGIRARPSVSGERVNGRLPRIPSPQDARHRHARQPLRLQRFEGGGPGRAHRIGTRTRTAANDQAQCMGQQQPRIQIRMSIPASASRAAGLPAQGAQPFRAPGAAWLSPARRRPSGRPGARLCGRPSTSSSACPVITSSSL